MPIGAVFFLLMAILLNSGSSIFYKWSSQQSGGTAALLFFIGITLGAFNAFFYARSLARIRLDVAYPLFSAGSVLLVTVMAAVVFAETFSVKQGVGIAVVLFGIALVTSP